MLCMKNMKRNQAINNQVSFGFFGLRRFDFLRQWEDGCKVDRLLDSVISLSVSRHPDPTCLMALLFPQGFPLNLCLFNVLNIFNIRKSRLKQCNLLL
jgi:hypothetical protein